MHHKTDQANIARNVKSEDFGKDARLFMNFYDPNIFVSQLKIKICRSKI